MKFLYKHKESTYEFQLSNQVSVRLVSIEPPFYCPLRLLKDGVKLHGISLDPDESDESLVAKIKKYYKTQQNGTVSDAEFIQQLSSWGLDEFANRIETAVWPNDENIQRLE